MGTALVAKQCSARARQSADSRTGKLQASTTLPSISAIKRSTIAHGASVPSLEISGTNFVSGCKVNVNDSPRATTSFEATKITIALTAADIAQTGKLKLKVVNPNNETSNEFGVDVS